VIEINIPRILTVIMCGRYAFYLPPAKLKSFFGLENLINCPARYNCAPCQELPIVVKNRVGFGRWGFRPDWSREDDPAMASKMINARSETIAQKSAFRDAWALARRCIVPANGFYEWHKDAASGIKQPYYITHKVDEVLCMAGLWSKVDGQVSFTVLTKPADGDISNYHHRMPVMIERDQVGHWFEADLGNATEMIGAASGEQCSAHKVRSDVGKVANDYAALIESYNGDQGEGHMYQSSML